MKVFVVSAFDFINSNSASAKRIKNVSSLIKGEKVYLPYLGSYNVVNSIKYFIKLRKYSLLNPQNVFYYYPTTNPLFELIWIFYVIKYRFVVYYDLNEKRAILRRLNHFDLKSIRDLLVSLIKYPIFRLLEKAYPINNKLIVISRNFEKKYDKKANCVLIPSLVEIPSTIHYPIEKQFKARLGFFGTISLYKEDFYTIFKALSILNLAGVRYHIDIYGTIYRDRIEFERLIRVFNIEDQVSIHSFISNMENVMNAMRKVDLLLLIRQNNVQTKYGFSTKLAEYLLSGTPVIATDVSDNAHYLKHAQNGFLLCDSNPEKLSELLINIHSGGYNLFDIGKKGIDTALNYFDASKYSDIINS